MDQPTFADLEYQGKKRKTRLEMFLEGVASVPSTPGPEGGAIPILCPPC